MKSKIKRAAELRTTLSQRRWEPAKRVTGATKLRASGKILITKCDITLRLV